MRTLLLCAALLAVLGARDAAAYSHSAVNKSKYTIHFWVNYKACSNDSWDLKPGQTVTWRSGLCCISSINVKTPFNSGRLDKPRIPGQLEGQELARYIGFDGFYHLLCQNTNWRLDAEPADQDGNGDWTSIERL